jgi:hypothetical protein
MQSLVANLKAQPEVGDSSPTATSTTCQLKINSVTKQQAWQRGLLAGGVCLGLAVAVLPIPIVHFAAIFIVLFLAPAATYGVYRVYSGSKSWEGEGGCPHCNQLVKVRVGQINYPVTETCRHCARRFVVEPLIS